MGQVAVQCEVAGDILESDGVDHGSVSNGKEGKLDKRVEAEVLECACSGDWRRTIQHGV